MNQVVQWLQSAGLDQYIASFQAVGITVQQFLQITIQDYVQFGITSLQDKQKLFRLITQLKSQQDIPQQQNVQQIQQQVVQKVQQQNPQQQNYQQQVEQHQQPQQQVLQGCPNVFTQNPTAHPNCPQQIDGRGIPTISRTVIPPDQQFLDIIQQKIRVVVRKRPANNQELQLQQKDIISCDSWNQISVHEPKVKVDLTKFIEISTYKFDHVFNEYSDNYEVYFYTAKPLVNAIFQGKNATCFAYGQTGSGKTWTMMQRETGIYVLAANDIFHMLQDDPTYNKLKLQAWVSFYEIYGGKLFDLLNQRKLLRALEDGKGVVQIFGIFEKQIHTVNDMLAVIDQGLQSRQVGATGANADSSRSHAILQIVLKAPNKQVHGKISFIDLAGAERASDVQNTDRQTRMEGAEINMSLLALKECIRAMDRGNPHLPFRDSKLTLVLRDSFIKDSKTVMIACCSPTDRSCENTQNTLRYSDRVKDLMQGGNKQKVAVIKPSQNVADILLGKVENDDEAAQQQYMQNVQNINNQQNQQNQRQSLNFQMQQQVQQQQVQYQQQIVQQPIQQQDVYKDPSRAPSNARADELAKSHCNIVDKIYELEDEITRAHRAQVDSMMNSVKQEVALLHQIENGQISMDDWVSKLESILSVKEQAITQLRGQILQFKTKLQEEQKMSESWREKK